VWQRRRVLKAQLPGHSASLRTRVNRWLVNFHSDNPGPFIQGIQR
jgi:hypothetical protein